jgi:DNA-binding NtrC family response regulator
MQKLRGDIERVAPIPSPVLIVGESGSGKELVARDVHASSGRASSPFVALNSAAMPDTLVESELFGHERGAFTGADRLRRGAFERAESGTLFLDEIGELPAAAQAKLLRVLEARQLTRIGGEKPVPVDARIVAATHRDLEAEVAAGRFREDLYYRLNVHVLRVPPLRDRLSDVPPLVDHFLRTITARFGMRPKSIAPDALALLTAFEWRRNNVRELRNIVERLIIAADGDAIEARDVPSGIAEAGVAPPLGDAEPRTFQELKAEAERRILLAALHRSEWHITRTAEELGLADHSSLLKIMRRHEISRENA